MTVAADVHGLKKRLDSFVWNNRSPEASLLRRLLDEHFGRFEGVGVVGGLVRDLARGGRAAFKSDVDLVVVGGAREVDALALRVGAQANRFGGYGFKAGPWLIDFWALERTWAVAEGHVAAESLADVVRCTFFDWDSAVYDVRNMRVHCPPGYLDRIRRGRLDITLRTNPGEIGNLLRAARRILRWRLDPGPGLCDFILQRLDEPGFHAIRARERRKHVDQLLNRFDSAAELRDALLAPKDRDATRQMSLDLRSA